MNQPQSMLRDAASEAEFRETAGAQTGVFFPDLSPCLLPTVGKTISEPQLMTIYSCNPSASPARVVALLATIYNFTLNHIGIGKDRQLNGMVYQRSPDIAS